MFLPWKFDQWQADSTATANVRCQLLPNKLRAKKENQDISPTFHFLYFIYWIDLNNVIWKQMRNFLQVRKRLIEC